MEYYVMQFLMTLVLLMCCVFINLKTNAWYVAVPSLACIFICIGYMLHSVYKISSYAGTVIG